MPNSIPPYPCAALHALPVFTGPKSPPLLAVFLFLLNLAFSTLAYKNLYNWFFPIPLNWSTHPFLPGQYIQDITDFLQFVLNLPAMNWMIMPYTPIVMFQKLYDTGWVGILEMIMSEDEPLRVGLVPLCMRTQSAFTWVRTLKKTMNRYTPWHGILWCLYLILPQPAEMDKGNVYCFESMVLLLKKSEKMKTQLSCLVFSNMVL